MERRRRRRLCARARSGRPGGGAAGQDHHLDDALEAGTLSWTACQTAPAAYLHAVLAQDAGVATGYADWKHMADIISGFAVELEHLPAP
jgi:hypothetical protein